MPALFTFTGIKRKTYDSCDSQHWGDQEKRCLQAGRKIGQYRVEPEEEEIGFGGGLNDRRIRLTARTVGSEYCCANGNRGEDCCGEEGILPNCSRYKWSTIPLRQLMVFRRVCRATNDAAGHRPLVDAKLEDHPHVEAREDQ